MEHTKNNTFSWIYGQNHDLVSIGEWVIVALLGYLGNVWLGTASTILGSKPLAGRSVSNIK